MPRIGITLSKLQLNTGELLEARDRAIKAVMLGATRAFALVASQNVPVDTGMARGSFRTRVNFFGEDRPLGRSIIIQPKPSKHKKKYRSGGYKSITRGKELSMYNLTRNSSGSYSFSFESKVWHYQVDEFHAIVFIKSSPWYSLMRGRTAYRNYIQKNLPLAIRSLADYMYSSSITGGHAHKSWGPLKPIKRRRTIHG